MKFLCKYLTWYGSANNPLVKVNYAIGTIADGWFTSYTGVRKKITSKGFEIIKTFS